MNAYPTTESPYIPELLRLVGGQPIALQFKARGKVILLTPGTLYGFEENVLVIAGVGEKCGLIDLREINVTPMIRAGLSSHAATVLKSELERTYHNANTKTYDHASAGEKGRSRSGGKSRRKSTKAKQPDNGSGRQRKGGRRTAKSEGSGKRT